MNDSEGLCVKNLKIYLGGDVHKTKTYSFSVEPQEMLCVSGPSGIGKTTLLKALCGLLPPHWICSPGSIKLNGVSLQSLPPEKRKIGMLFQEPALFPHLNVLENASLGLRLSGVSKKQAELKTQEWLNRFGLIEKQNESVTQLSGGEKQRVGFIRALIWKPKLLLLDEPFSALDEQWIKKLQTELEEIMQAEKLPIVIVSHEPLKLCTQKLDLTPTSSLIMDKAP